ncbi:MAG: S41 family peptidase [Fimbriimonadaceae bacterium]|nr:S41 family peptidase [Fimbriimonadaceae bacterium]
MLLAILSAGLSEPAPTDSKISQARIRQDLTELRSAFEDLHPDPYWRRPKGHFERRANAFVGAHPAGIPPAELFREVARFVVDYDDPHSWAFVPGWREHVTSGGKFFPVDIRFENGRAYVEGTGGHPELQVGQRCLSLNERSFVDLYREFRPLSGDRKDPYGEESLTTFFRRYWWRFYGPSDVFRLKVAGSDKSTRVVVVPAVDRTVFEAFTRQSVAPLTWRKIDADTALIEFRACVSADEIQKLAQPIFSEIKQRKFKYLIVDARLNSGGGDDGWRMLLNYLTDKPSTAYRGSSFRVTNRLKTLLGEERIRNGYQRSAWEAANGQWFRFEPAAPELTPPEPQPESFGGKWIVLSGRRTFSSGMSFVAAVKQYQLAPVIGQETGGRQVGYGQWVQVQLPHSKIAVAISTKQFTGIVPVKPGRGVPPDIAVRQPVDAVPYTATDATFLEAMKQLKR